MASTRQEKRLKYHQQAIHLISIQILFSLPLVKDSFSQDPSSGSAFSVLEGNLLILK